MELIDTIAVRHRDTERLVMLFVGDVARLPSSEAVDVLVVSAFPDDYVPTSGSAVGALSRVGVSVAELAEHKEVDLRRFSSCWLSRPIDRPDLHFRRLLCFEPGYRGKAPEVVGDIFRSIFPFTAGDPPMTQVAMPLLASGDQGEPREAMLEALVDASVQWLSAGLPIDRIKIVIRESRHEQALRDAFDRVKRRHAKPESDVQRPAFHFDAFVSYSQKNAEAIDCLVKELTSRRPALRLFMDRLELRPGSPWQQHIFEALDASRKVICAFSPEYVASKICKDEYNMAVMRHRDTESGVLMPVYLYTAELPTYMKLLQWQDAREGDPVKIAQSAANLLKQL